jgi:hypothetical protein
MENKALQMNNLKEQVAKTGYDVDERAVAEAIVRRLSDAALWLGPKRTSAEASA